jgi:S-adenosylmethionine/arginine decarboxylase-like enzyme
MEKEIDYSSFIPPGMTTLINISVGKDSAPKLQDAKLLTNEFLVTLVRKLGMTILIDTLTYKEIPVPDTDLISVTGMTALLESHVCFHTWPEYNYMRLEISTCRQIDDDAFEEAMGYIFSFFHFTKIEMIKQDW